MNGNKGKILIVDDDKSFCDFKADLLGENNYRVNSVQSADKVIEILQATQYDLVLLDLNIGGVNGIEILKKIKDLDPDIEVIMITGYEAIATAVQAIKLGAYDYLQKNIKDEELIIKIDRAIEKHKNILAIKNLKDALSKHFGLANIVGNNPKMHEVYNLVRKICNTDATVLIKGETGTGKELIAKAVHFNSQRKEGAFIAVNCAAISETLMESELFGHEKGAFTDAYKQRIGKIEVANGGTLFLDEIGDMSLSLQAKLLRFLQDKKFERIGSNETLTSDVRIITATNKDLLQLIKTGKFREDLYYRINVMSIELPPLREKLDDLPLLLEHFIKLANIKFNKNVKELSKEAIKRLTDYTWPGNVRELENLIDRVVLVSEEDIIKEEDVVRYLQMQEILPTEPFPNLDLTLKDAREDAEKRYLIGLLNKYYGNIKLVSDKSGLDRKSIFTKMEKYGLRKEGYKSLK